MFLADVAPEVVHLSYSCGNPPRLNYNVQSSKSCILSWEAFMQVNYIVKFRFLVVQKYL